MKEIDINTWKRKIPYENFIGYTNPIFSLNTRLDVTNLYNRCKREKTSFFTDFLFVAIKCLNSIEDFRIRICNGKLVLYEVAHPSYIILSDDDVILTCKTLMNDNYHEFYKNVRNDMAKRKSEAKKITNFNYYNTNDCYFISCLPWVDVGAINNPYNLTNQDESSIPRITWSKFVEENGRKKMMMDIAAHHALIDGEAICKAFNKIQAALDNIEEFLNTEEK